ncbi:hypothetical protein [Mycobacterium sp. SMC-11]|uniref:hypothetical protein n=1 Tax=Mycobacterium sp. SMC-11 TaxID=3385969 RepID=UPI00390C683A
MTFDLATLQAGDPDREHRTVALLTPHHLVIAVRPETVTLTAGIALTADSGISVVAQWSGTLADQAIDGCYLALGDDQDGTYSLASCATPSLKRGPTEFATAALRPRRMPVATVDGLRWPE